MKNFFLAIIITVLTSGYSYGQEIVLIRHAEVFLEHSGWISSKKATDYRKEYDTAPIVNFQADSVLAQLPKRNTDTIYVSALTRSIATGLLLYGDSANIVSIDMLNEFEMHIIWLPLVLPYKGWTAFSRGMWLLGAKKQGTESFSDAKERVKFAANFIENKIANQKQVILVTHGFINRNIAKELEKRGWKITQNNGNENLGATVLNK